MRPSLLLSFTHISLALITLLPALLGEFPFLLSVPAVVYISPQGNDGNDCASPQTACATLQEGISKVAPEGTVKVQTGVYTSNGYFVAWIDKNVNLSGGWDETFSTQNQYSTIDGQETRQGLGVAESASGSIEGFIIQNGYDDESDSFVGGGGIHAIGNLTIRNCSIQSNFSKNYGGGILNFAELIIKNSSVSNNQAIISDYSEYGGGGIEVFGTLKTENTTVSRNYTNRYGGGIQQNGRMFLVNTTISDNTAGVYGGGIEGDLYLNGFEMRNIILAGNHAPQHPDCIASVYSRGYNIVGTGCYYSPDSTDQVNLEVPLGDYQETPGYHPLLLESPALDAGNPDGCLGIDGNILNEDQRGRPRFGRCDIGAYELQPLGYASFLVTPASAIPGEYLVYQMALSNPGSSGSGPMAVENHLPSGLLLDENSLNASGGLAWIESGAVHWEGEISAGQNITITYSTQLSPQTSYRQSLANLAIITTVDETYPREAVLEIPPAMIYLPSCIQKECAPQTQPLYYDNFSNPNSGWPVKQGGSNRYGYINGEYRMQLSSWNSFQVVSSSFSASDFAASVYIREDHEWDGYNTSYGLVFGLSSDGQEFYTFEIERARYYSVYRYDHGYWYQLRKESASGMFDFPATNRLKVERRGSQIKLYINSVLMDTIIDDNFMGYRKLGLIATLPSPSEANGYFDNYTVYEVDCGKLLDP